MSSQTPGSLPQAESDQGARRRALHLQGQAYAELKQQLHARGLLEKQPVYYMIEITSTVVAFIAAWVILPWLHPLWLLSLDAVVLAVLTAQVGFIGHDAGHRQIARRTGHNDLIGWLAGNVLLGMSFAWWVEKHNQHHSHPNEVDTDPDIRIPFLAFSAADAARKRGVMRVLLRSQAVLFFPLLCLESFALQAQGLPFLLSGRAKHPLLESSLLLLHFLWYFGVLFYFLPPWQALLFLAIQQGLTGLLLGLAFAPNHKGMPLLDSKTSMDFLHRQVITARNVRGHPLVDWWYGGLNYQIEHHLFPTMARNQLKHAQPLIRQFCAARALPYCETSMGHSYREIVQYLHTVGQTPTGMEPPAASPNSVSAKGST